MKIKFLLVAGTILLALSAIAQKVSKEVTTHLGPEIKEGRRDIPIIAGIDETNAYILHIKRKTIKVDRVFKADLSPSSSAKLKRKRYNQRNTYFYGTYYFGQKLYLFYTYTNRYDNTISLLAREVDAETLAGGDTYTELASVPYTNLRDIAYSGLFDVRISPNHKSMLIVSQLTVNDMKRLIKRDAGKPYFHMTVVDENFASIWDDDIKLPFKKGRYSIDGFRVEDNGAVVAVAFESKSKTALIYNRRDGKPDYSYHVLYYNSRGEGGFDIPVSLDSVFVTEMQAAIDSKGNIVASGFYAKQSSFTMQGVFYMTFDTLNGIQTFAKAHRINTWFADQDKDKKDAKKSKKAAPKVKTRKKAILEPDENGPPIYNLHLDNLIVGENNEIVLVAEQNYVVVVATTTRSSNGTTTTHYTYYYYSNDILSVSFNDAGEINWKCRIPKKQYSVNDGGRFNSYVSSYSKGTLHIFFNETIGKSKKLNNENVPVFYPGKDTRVVMVSVGKDGEKLTELVSELTGSEYMLEPSSSRVYPNGELMMYLRHKGQYRIANLKIKA